MTWRGVLRRAVTAPLHRAGYDLVPLRPPTGSPGPDRYREAYDRLQVLTERYGDCLAGPDLSPYEFRLFSQNGEDGVTAEILKRIGCDRRWFVEFGASTGSEGCCVALADVFGWSGLFIEADPTSYQALAAKYQGNPRVVTRNHAVTVGNVEALFAEAGVPAEPDVLSIDIDGNDYWVWEAIVRYRPRLIIIEYNANLDADSTLVRAFDETRGWDQTAWFSASVGALETLGRHKGYTLVHTDLAGVNAFFVRDDLVEKVGVVVVPRRAANYGLVGGRHPRADGHPWTDVGAARPSADSVGPIA